jgi:hypothetical protein
MAKIPFQKPTNEMVRRFHLLLSRGVGVQRRTIDVQIHSVGIDLGKTTFHLVALGAAVRTPCFTV